MKPLFLVALILIPSTVFGGGLVYEPMIGGFPGMADEATDFNAFINGLYAISIAVAALLAVIKIIIAGVKWMLTDVVTSKGEAKKDIQGALLGLLVILAAVLILTTINESIIDVNLEFKKIDPGTYTGRDGSSGDGADSISGRDPGFEYAIDDGSPEGEQAVQDLTERCNEQGYILENVNGEWRCYEVSDDDFQVYRESLNCN
jgi:hypothetical protein